MSITGRRSPRVTIFPDEHAVAQALARRHRRSGRDRTRGSCSACRPDARRWRFYASWRRCHARRRRLLAGDDLQPRRVPRHPVRTIRAATAASWNTHLFNHVNLAPEDLTSSNGSARDPTAECARYEREIAAAGGIDLQMLGIGTNGHIGFNEPAPTLEARTHRVDARAGDAAQQRGALRRRSGERCRRRRCRWGWRRSCRRARSCCSRPGRPRRRASSGRAWADDDRSCRRRSCSCTPTSSIMLDGQPRGSSRASSTRARAVGGTDVLADRLAHRVVGLLQPAQRLRQRQVRSSASRSPP